MLKMLYLLILVITILSNYSVSQETLTVDEDLKNELQNYLVEHYQTPEEYIINKFDNHDIVFIGEFHRVKHDVEFIHSLIPLLYKNGVYNLGLEFANYADQENIDRLITAQAYNDSLAQQIQFNQWPFWGYQEYIDIYKIAWNINRNLSDKSRKFRIVGLNAIMDWSHVWTEEDRRNPEIMKKTLPQGHCDEMMAKVIFKEFIESGEKALIYMGIRHAYTEYRQPDFDMPRGNFIGFMTRAGNRVYTSIGKNCITVFLHSPWYDSNLWDLIYPVDGIIDALMLSMENEFKPVGFDVKGTPFEKLTCRDCLERVGHTEFNLGTYCDGYIYQKPLSEYEDVTVVEGFINEDNRLYVIAQSANPSSKDTSRTVEQLIDGMSNNVKRMLHKFK